MGNIGMWGARTPGFLVLAGISIAASADDGFYIGIDAGLAGGASVDVDHVLVNHPTRCDSLLYGAGMSPPADPACADNTPRSAALTGFGPGGSSAFGLQAGYGWGRLRMELEYAGSDSESEMKDIPLAGGNTALASKDSEWASAPTTWLDNLRARKFFVNGYWDFPNGSAWTPYLGAGVGSASMSVNYGVKFVRKPQDGYLAISFDPDWPEEARRRAAGTLSEMDVNIEQSQSVYQLIAGVDRELAENVSAGVKFRWTAFEGFDTEENWWVIRSHAPVRADGQTPFTSVIDFDGWTAWQLSVGLKYRF